MAVANNRQLFSSYGFAACLNELEKKREKFVVGRRVQTTHGVLPDA
jgi:hypothetical protein